VGKKSAEEIFELIKTFGRYGFNKSHSTAYALLAFQTAYLKAHYPVHYLAALLSGELNDTDKIAQYIQEAREMAIPLYPPDVNRSGAIFEVADVDTKGGAGPIPDVEGGGSINPAEGRGGVRHAESLGLSYALAAVKNVGEGAARSIVDERKRGPYASLLDFTSRVDLRLVNKRVIESLVKCGAMDCFGETRSTLFTNIDRVMEHGASRQGDRLKGQNSLFGETDEGLNEQEFFSLQKLQEWDDADKSEYEKEAMGFYFRSHPTAGFQDLAAQHGALMIGELKSLPSESAVTIFGMIESLKKIVTKDGKEMAFLTIGDLTGSVEAVVFPSVYEKHSRHLQGKGVVVLAGRVSGEKVFADRIMSPEEFAKSAVSQIHVQLARSYTEDSLIRLRDIFLQNTGKCHVFIHVPELETQKKVVKVSDFLLVDPNDALIDRVRREGLAERIWVS
jgi:DNA polymerase-3 subunit alpha